MIKRLLIACFVLALIEPYRSAKAQVQITTNDTLVCPGDSVFMSAIMNGRIPTPIPILVDDTYSGVVNFNFPFIFYGNSYSSCVISSNGYIDFDISQANQYSAWSIGSGIPGNTNVSNSIMGFYADIFPNAPPPAVPGTMDWSVMGTAPNRIFIVTYSDVPMFSCTAMKTSFQIIIYESSNVIDVMIKEAPSCLAWNGGLAIEGVQNITSTFATAVAGRNAQIWTTQNDGYRFTPQGTTNYTVAPQPFHLIPNANSPILWYENGTTLVGTGPSLTVLPTSLPCFYVARTISAQDTTADTMYVGLGGLNPIDSFQVTHPSICGMNDGTITLFGLDPNTAFLISFDKFGLAQTPVSANSGPSGIAYITGLGAGTYTNIKAGSASCVTPPVGPAILVDPAFIVDYTFDIKFGCDGDTVFFQDQSTVVGSYAATWTFGDGTGSNLNSPTHIYLAQNLYNPILEITNGYCTKDVDYPVDLLHPLVADFIVDDDSVCQGQVVSFTNTSTATSKFGIDPSYFWDFGDGQTSTQKDPLHTYNLSGVHVIKMVVSDFVPCTDTAYHIIVVDSLPTASFIVSSDKVCEGESIEFTADYFETGFTGLSWDFGDGNILLDQNPIGHSYDTSGSFTVTFTAQYRICNDVVVSQNINIHPQPKVDIGPDTTLCPNSEPLYIYDLINSANPTAKFAWNTGDSSAGIRVVHEGEYAATVTIDGCSSTDSMSVYKDCYLDLPNTFTPNGDGVNDYFYPRQLLSQGVVAFKMTVFNRWGEKIWETDKTDGRGWDGRFNGDLQPQGVYIYMIEAHFKNQTHETYKGNVTLLR